jgi:Na+/melibiose symporter-like transporter
VLSVLAAFSSAFLLLMMMVVIGDPEADAGGWTAVTSLWAIPLWMWFWVYRLARRRRPRGA